MVPMGLVESREQHVHLHLWKSDQISQWEMGNVMQGLLSIPGLLRVWVFPLHRDLRQMQGASKVAYSGAACFPLKAGTSHGQTGRKPACTVDIQVGLQ
jgi:hypothetical protein